MFTQQNLRIFILFDIFSSTSQGATLSAGSFVCYGLVGSVDHPQQSCSNGDAGGGGAVIIGGSGVGSGINYPFATTSDGSEFSASAAALQDYGIFKGYANMHIKEQNPGIFGGGGGAQASGEYSEMWTIGGGTGQGRLNLGFSLTGSGKADLFVSGGNNTESAQANLSITVRINDVFGGAIVTSQSGTYQLLPDGPNAMIFTFGVPFKMDVLNIVTAGGGYDRLNPPKFFQVDANASFEHTSVLSAVAVTDLFGNNIPNFSLTAESGTQYPLASAVPLPGGFGLFGLSILLIGWIGAGRRFFKIGFCTLRPLVIF